MEKFTIKEAAAYMGFQESGIRNIIYARKKVPYEKIGRFVYIKKEDLDIYKNKRRVGVYARYSKEVANEWLELYKKGHSFVEISKGYTCSPSTISTQLKKKFPDFVFNTYHYKLSEEDKIIYREAKELYYSDNNISIEDVKRQFPIVTSSKFTSYLKRTGNSLKDRSQIKGKCQNHDFFSKIDSEIKAYLLGFFAADGHIEYVEKQDTYCLKFLLHLKDAHVLMLYNKYLCNGKATIGVRKNERAVWFSVGSNQIGKDLKALGYDNRKTYSCNSLPTIPEEMYPHFIRGLFDGDGSASLTRRLAANRLNGYNKIVCISGASLPILESIVNKIGISVYNVKEQGIGEEIIIRGVTTLSTVKGYQLQISNPTELKKLHKYLYENASFFFKRKKDIFDLCLLETHEIDGALQGNL